MENENSKLAEFDTDVGEIYGGGGGEEQRQSVYVTRGEGPSELVTAEVDGAKDDGDDEAAGGREVLTDDLDADTAEETACSSCRVRRCDLWRNDRCVACDRRNTVRALAHMIPAVDRARVDAWLEKLDGCEDAADRSQYVEYLLRAVADGGTARVHPFDRPPPRGPLRPLGEIVDPTLLLLLSPGRPYDGDDDHHHHHRHRACVAGGHRQTSETKPPAAAEIRTRETFYARQPIPEDGTFCYAAAFSYK